MSVTKQQFEVLQAAFKKNGGAYAKGSRRGGAKNRMIDRMVEKSLLDGSPPFPITLKGLHVLRDACEKRYYKMSCVAYLDDLREVEKALGLR